MLSGKFHSSPSKSGSRVVWVHLRDWPIVGCGYGDDDLVAVEKSRRLVAVSRAAAEAGVRHSMAQREAQTLCPKLLVVPVDRYGQERAFMQVLSVLDDFVATVEVSKAGACCFLAKGPSRYFGGEEAMCSRIIEALEQYLAGTTTVHIGLADSRFGAFCAAANTAPSEALILKVGDTSRYLSPLGVEILCSGLAELDVKPTDYLQAVEMVATFKQLGLRSLGDLAALEYADILGRFGSLGSIFHHWSNGFDHSPLNVKEPPAELSFTRELNPPITKADRAVFVTKALAEEFCEALNSRGLSCSRIVVAVETATLQYQERIWRSCQAFDAEMIAERMRWQIDGWISGPKVHRPNSALVSVSIRPDAFGESETEQLSLWQTNTSGLDSAVRSIARVQAQVGPGSVWFASAHGGRGVGDSVSAVAAETIDLAEISKKVSVSEVDKTRSWPGALPKPEPSVKFGTSQKVDVLGLEGSVVQVGQRLELSTEPLWLVWPCGKTLKIVANSAPWPLVECWWDDKRYRRCVRMQVVTEDQYAFLVTREHQQWFLEAVYD